MDKFGERGRAAFARAVGVAAATFDAYESGSVPNALVLGKMIAATNCSPDWLLYGQGPMFRPPGPEERLAEHRRERDEVIARLRHLLVEAETPPPQRRPTPTERPTDIPAGFIAIPLLADPAAAGRGLAIDESEIEDYLLIYAADCPHPKATSALRVRGDSMEPVLPDGSLVAVDTSVRNLAALDGALVAVRDPDDGGVTVKTLLLREGTAVLRPANRDYADQTLPAGRLEDEGLIVGRVIWSMSRR